MDNEEKIAFGMWMSGFEGRYTKRQIEIFKKCWQHTVATRRLKEELGEDLEDQRWEIDWITDVAYRIGK